MVGEDDDVCLDIWAVDCGVSHCVSRAQIEVLEIYELKRN